ncbi:hypothetical protein ACQKNS_02280 [Peribacillus sp. NPDC094092]|uniref:hypothetical protein n=1 Tax=Peribacillus sp. NPDC094092 TaxID=3390611 RepID=UPI003D06DEDC
MFPKLAEEEGFDSIAKVMTKSYILMKEPLLLQRKEKWEDEESSAYLLDDHDAGRRLAMVDKCLFNKLKTGYWSEGKYKI